ncbi:hypothetical protein Tco_0829275 [Tanacetum coccineum]
MNRLKVDTLTPELLTGPTFKLMKGSCKSLVELEYFLEEVYKATTDQLDWNNPEGQQYPHDLRKPLPLIPNSRGRQVIPFDHFINNDLAYLSGGVSSRKYTTSVTKTKAVDYGHIKWIEYLVPNTMWIQVPIEYDKHAFWEISHWGRKRKQFYAFAVNREFAHDVYSKRRIIAAIKLEIVEWKNYQHLEWITVHQDDDKLYKFKEGDLKRLHIQDIKHMLLLLVQGKLTNLTVEERLAFNVSLRMFTRGIVIQRRVDDLQLEQRQEEQIDAYYELHKFSDGTLDDVQTALDDRLKGIQMQYLPQTIWRQSDRDKATTKDQEDYAELGEIYFYTSAGNPVKEILLKLNLHDHRSILTDSKAENKMKSEKKLPNNNKEQKAETRGRAYAARERQLQEGRPTVESNKNQEKWNECSKAYAVGVAGQNPDNIDSKCRSPVCWAEVEMFNSPVAEIVQNDTPEKFSVKQSLQRASDRQMSYADLKRKSMVFAVGDKVMLKVSLGKGVYVLAIQGNLNPRFVGTFHAVPLDGLYFDDKRQFVEVPERSKIVEVKRLRRSHIPFS